MHQHPCAVIVIESYILLPAQQEAVPALFLGIAAAVELRCSSTNSGWQFIKYNMYTDIIKRNVSFLAELNQDRLIGFRTMKPCKGRRFNSAALLAPVRAFAFAKTLLSSQPSSDYCIIIFCWSCSSGKPEIYILRQTRL